MSGAIWFRASGAPVSASKADKAPLLWIQDTRPSRSAMYWMALGFLPGRISRTMELFAISHKIRWDGSSPKGRIRVLPLRRIGPARLGSGLWGGI